ncbi:hypothetical protein NL676_011597 [Syzygium grande]|nr:hypothetical protein NL676_011597 [Syzygium grande]
MRLRDLLLATFLLLFFLLLFTPWRPTPVAHSARRPALAAAEVEPGGFYPRRIGSCPASYVDHMPCEDPRRSSQLSREMNYYRERHCPPPEETPLCLVPPPDGYKVPVRWPESLNKIWHSNMPYNKIADRKDGAGNYLEKLKKYVPLTGGVVRTALDMGCGVASFGGALLAEGILTMSFAPRDSHKAQIQFALERGIPAFVAMLGTRRLPFPSFSFDLVHCSRCLIPFTAYNASYFIEVDRLLRPGGYLVISGPPVQWAKQEKEWADLQAVARALCYEVIAVDRNTAVWRKPTGDSCLPNQNELGIKLCDEFDDSSVAWYIKLKTCVSRTSSVKGDYAVGSIPKWPDRLNRIPVRAGLLGGGTDIFEDDTRRWTRRVDYYKKSLNLKLGTPSVRNVMDMNSFFGGFAAALSSDPVWVMNVVPADKPSTLSAIYDRGLIGVYHDWCEPFSTYPRTYDFIHIDGIAMLIERQGSKRRCSLVDLMVEMDRILRPEGTVLIRDSPEVIDKVNYIAHAVSWTTVIYEKDSGSPETEKILVATKTIRELSSESH